MRYEALLARARDLPVIDTRTLRTWVDDPKALSVQLSRWVSAGKLLPLRRGIYLLPPALRHVDAPDEYLANLLVVPSYVSLERALAFHGLLPERVPLVQSVTTGRPALFRTGAGDFQYRHVKRELFFGYLETPVGAGTALIARPEKALLDLAYLSTGPFTPERIDELRLQNVESLKPAELVRMAAGQGDHLKRAAAALARWIRRER
jgi:predicted transcriptional regulator of viral defense system